MLMFPVKQSTLNINKCCYEIFLVYVCNFVEKPLKDRLIVSYLSFLVSSPNVHCKVPMLEDCRIDMFVFCCQSKI